LSGRILNRKDLAPGHWPEGALYVGRGSVLGNPYRIDEDGDRDAVCEKHETLLREQVERGDPAVLTALYGIGPETRLVCYCAPKRCHAQTILAVRESLPYPTREGRSMTYAGVGSRKTPPEVLDRMTRAARRLALLGYTLNSGGAAGADSAFEAGASGNANILLPFPGFRGHHSTLNQPPGEAFRIAQAVHPAWGRLGGTAKAMMARNSQQILGPDLSDPVDFVLCWTPDGAETEADRTRGTGGTGQAIALADRWGIPVFNMAHPDALERLSVIVRDRPAREAGNEPR